MAQKKDVRAVRQLYDEIRTIKKDLSAAIEQTRRDTDRSDEYKRKQIEVLVKAARERLDAIGKKAPDKIAALRNAEKPRFSYDDPRLQSALNFITLQGKNVPAEAWQTMQRDFSGRVAELSFLASALKTAGAAEGSIALAEAAKSVATSESLPDRAEDNIYYLCASDPAADVNTGGIEAELARLESISESEGDDT